MVAARSDHLGQPPDHAPRAPLRREPAARHAPHHRRRRRADGRAAGGGVAVTDISQPSNRLKSTASSTGNAYWMLDAQSEAGPPLRPCFTVAGVHRGIIEILPVAAFLIPFGIAFGVAASAKGVGAEVSLLMSMAVY